jgi:hypothetical protein
MLSVNNDTGKGRENYHWDFVTKTLLILDKLTPLMNHHLPVN